MLVLKHVSDRLTSKGGFQWPERGEVVDTRRRGHGLYAWRLSAAGLRFFRRQPLDHEPPRYGGTICSVPLAAVPSHLRWLTLELDEQDARPTNSPCAVRCSRCRVVWHGDRDGAIDYVLAADADRAALPTSPETFWPSAGRSNATGLARIIAARCPANGPARFAALSNADRDELVSLHGARMLELLLTLPGRGTWNPAAPYEVV